MSLLNFGKFARIFFSFGEEQTNFCCIFRFVDGISVNAARVEYTEIVILPARTERLGCGRKDCGYALWSVVNLNQSRKALTAASQFF